MSEPAIYGGIEFGGTKTVVAVGYATGEVLASDTFPTDKPAALTQRVHLFFSSQERWTGVLAGIGVGAFGPVSIKHGDQHYGHILETNKPGWSGFNLAGKLAENLPVPQALITDVAAAGVGEAQNGALRDIQTGVYLTIGTGIGGAIMYRGEPLSGLMHPEIGHLPIQRQEGDTFQSICRFHDSCAEGLASGPAIMARFGKPLNAFAADSEEVALIGDYLGQLLASIVLMISPERIVLGGGVSQCAGLLEQARQTMQARLNGYAPIGVMAEDFLVPPELGTHSGIVGALVAAGRGLQDGSNEYARQRA